MCSSDLGLEDAVALARQLEGGAAGDAGHGPEAAARFGPPPAAQLAAPGALANAGSSELLRALERYNGERLPVVHRYQQRSRDVSARTGRMRRPAGGGGGHGEQGAQGDTPTEASSGQGGQKPLASTA